MNICTIRGTDASQTYRDASARNIPDMTSISESPAEGVLTITTDNGSEFSQHKLITKALNSLTV